jgi:hypothetical protein
VGQSEPEAEQRAVRSLRDDLASGRWVERNRDLVALAQRSSAFACRNLNPPQPGYKLLSAPGPWLPARRDAVGCRARPLGRRAGNVG